MLNPIKNTQLISRSEFEAKLKSFGLFICNDSVCKYIDNYPMNENFYELPKSRVFTIDFIDSTKVSWANTNGLFYKNHTIPKTSLFKEFKEFVSNHTFQIGNHFLI